MRTRGTIRLATRNSQLAMAQSTAVARALEDRRYEVELVPVETTGDQLREELIHRLGKTGAFVRELDERVLAGECDAAVHSLKDVPTEGPAELVTAAVPERAAPGDVLVTPDGSRLEELPAGAVVGTASLRRRAQLLGARPDLTVEPIRGNVDTRLEKVLAPALQAELATRRDASDETGASVDGPDGTTDPDSEPGSDGEPGSDSEPGSDDESDSDDEPAFERTVEKWLDDRSTLELAALDRDVETHYDAIVLARAGLDRSGLEAEVETRSLPTATFVPAPGQGALAVTAVDGDVASGIQSVLDHPRSRVEVTVERTILATLGGGCVAPLGIYAVVKGEYVHTAVSVLERDGSDAIAATRDLPIERHAETAREFAEELADRGARELIERARRDDVGDGARLEPDETETDDPIAGDAVGNDSGAEDGVGNDSGTDDTVGNDSGADEAEGDDG